VSGDLIERLPASGDDLCLEAADELQRLREALEAIRRHAAQHPMVFAYDLAREAVQGVSESLSDKHDDQACPAGGAVPPGSAPAGGASPS
jgi:hypothetical protein